MHPKCSSILATFAIFVFLSSPLAPVQASADSIFTEDFESQNTSWNFGARQPGNSVEIVSDQARSGSQSARLSAVDAEEAGHAVGLQSPAFEVRPWSRVEASVWIMAEDVVSRGVVKGDWYKLRVNLSAFDKNEKRIRSRDIASVTGSFPWKRIQGGFVAPARTASMRLQVLLTTATGTVWVDDAEIRVVQEIAASQPPFADEPAIIPNPWKMKLTGERLPIGRVSVMNDPGHAGIFDHTGSAIRSRRVELAKPGQGQTGLYIGNASVPELDRRLRDAFPDHTWADLGSQGYFVSVQPSGQHAEIYVGANTPQGQFYGLQTLKQLIHDGTVYEGDILDRPTLEHRGIVMGIHFFDQRGHTPLQRLTDLKFNTVWNQGSFLDGAFLEGWRRSLSGEQKGTLRKYLDLYTSNFIDVWIAMRPTGKNPPISYSSEKDIDAVVDKFGDLYDLGFRNFALSFDDLENINENILLTDQDKSVFGNDFAAAQKHFVESVFRQLNERYPGSNFNFLPMKYANPGNLGTQGQAYLSSFKSLPHEVGITTVSEFDADIEAVADLTNRPNTLWSNYYAEGYNKAPDLVVPFYDGISWEDPKIRDQIDRFLWLPMVPYDEARSLIPWRTAAEFAWRPEDYDPDSAFARALAVYKSN